METTAKVFIFIFAVLSLGIWISELHPQWAQARVPSISLVPFEPGKLAAEQNTLPAFTATGVVIYDLAHGGSGTPYLIYVNQKGELMTKQLIFSPSDACDPTAGDLPCEAYGNGSDAADSVPAGTPITVTGGVESQGVFADSYKTASIPSTMAVFTATLNQPVTLSNDGSATLRGVASDASCSLGTGCFGDGVTRAVVDLSTGKATSTEEMVPGSIHEYGQTTFVVLSIQGTGTNVRAKILAIAAK